MKTVYLVYKVSLYEQDLGTVDSNEIPIAVFSKEELAKNYINEHSHPSSFHGINRDGELLYKELPFD